MGSGQSRREGSSGSIQEGLYPDCRLCVEGVDEASATSEIERYVVWPGQAIGYKRGQLRIVELREEARSTLSDAFDIRDFNQQVLQVALAPLSYIESTVHDWLARAAEPGEAD